MIKFFWLTLLFASLSFGKALQVSSKSMEGSQYFGGVKSPTTRLQSFNLTYSNEHFFSTNLSYAFNNSSLSLLSLSLTKKFMWETNSRLSIGFELGVGVANYRESISFQNVSIYGLKHNVSINADYLLNESASLIFSYGKDHYWMTNNKIDYWGSDPRTDYAFDFNSPEIGLIWRF